MSHSFNCPGGIIGAILAAEVRNGNGTPEMIERVNAEQKEWEEAGLKPGQWATRLQDGRLVAENSPEHIAEQREFLSRFTTPDGKPVFE